MKKILLLLLLMSQFGIAQEEECGVGGDENFTYQNYTANRNTTYNLAVTIHIVRSDSGVTTLDEEEFFKQFEEMNLIYGNQINFNVCSINYIDNSDYYNFQMSSEQEQLLEETAVDNTFNVYLMGSVNRGSSSYCGYAYYPSSRPYARAFVKNSCSTNGSTTPHELGHTLGLFHTHGNSNTFNATRELADGSNGDSTGDYIADTPSDPVLSSSIVNSNCEYTGDALDRNGELHKPNPKNLMSYSRKLCRDELSQGQINKVISVINDYYLDFQCQTLSAPRNDIQKIKVFPNPFNDKISISVESSYSLYDLNGRIVKFGIGKGIKTDELSNGIYILKLVYDDRLRYVKIIK